jgi:hypothetical protein
MRRASSPKTAASSHRRRRARTAPHRTAPHRTPHRTAPHRTAPRTAPRTAAPRRAAPRRCHAAPRRATVTAADPWFGARLVRPAAGVRTNQGRQPNHLPVQVDGRLQHLWQQGAERAARHDPLAAHGHAGRHVDVQGLPLFDTGALPSRALQVEGLRARARCTRLLKP